MSWHVIHASIWPSEAVSAASFIAWQQFHRSRSRIVNVATRSQSILLCTPKVRSLHGPLKAREIVQAASDAIARGIVVKDSGANKYWVTNHAPCMSPYRTVASCHFGSMGFGIPAAIGASIGCGESTVVATCGDGSILMALSDLLTAVTERCTNMKVIVFNNAGLGSTRDYERRSCRRVALRSTDAICRLLRTPGPWGRELQYRAQRRPRRAHKRPANARPLPLRTVGLIRQKRCNLQCLTLLRSVVWSKLPNSMNRSRDGAPVKVGGSA